MFSIHHYCFPVISCDTGRVFNKIRPRVPFIILVLIISIHPFIFSLDAAGSAGNIIITQEYNDGIKFDVTDVSVTGMKGRNVIFGFCISQNAKWLDNTWVKLDPVKVLYDPAWWKGNAFWFTYSYDELVSQADPAAQFWGSFFIMNADTNTQLGRKDIRFSLPERFASGEGTGDLTDTEIITEKNDSDYHNRKTLVTDDFSKNNLDDVSRYISFGENLFSVQSGVLKADLNSNLWTNMAVLNIFPCYGRNSTLSFDARWTDGAGASLAVLADWHYSHAGRRTIFYIHFNENSITSWNGNGAETVAVTFKKGQWYHFRLARTDALFILHVDNRKVMEKKVDQLSPVYNDAKESGYGGYGFETDIRPYRQVYEIDNLMVSGDISPTGFAGISRKFSISPADSRSYRFSVIFEKEYGKWAEGQADISVPYICSVAEILGVPAMNVNLGMVLCRGSYFYGNAGFNSRGVVYQYGENSAADALSSHELAHNWYYLYGNKWSIEGSADFCYFAYLEKDKKQLMQATDFLFNRETTGDSAMLAGGKSIFLDDDSAADSYFVDGMPDWDTITRKAWKQRVFFYIIYRLTGREGFRELHKKAYDLVSGRGRGMASAEVQDAVAAITGKNAGAIFKGWVFSGKGTIPLESVFTDTDDDGLCDLDESLRGTNPSKYDTDDDGSGDLGEIAAGFDPRSSGSPGRKTIIIDGLFTDWNNEEKLMDSINSGGAEDIISIRTLADTVNSRLLVCAEFNAEGRGVNNDAYFTLDIDINNDSNTDYRVNVFYGKKYSVNSFRTNGYAGVKWDPSQWTGLDASGVRYSYRKNLLEVSVPLSLIGDAKSVSLFVNSGSGDSTDWFDAAPVRVKPRSDQVKFPASVFFFP